MSRDGVRGWPDAQLPRNIRVVGPNPAMDRTINVDRLAFDDRAYILSNKDSPGGRGINAACVIHAFGGETLAILPAGGRRIAATKDAQPQGSPRAT